MISCTRIGTIVAETFGVPVGAVVRGRARRRDYMRPRQAAMYLARTLRNLSYPCIGRKFAKDHTTVMHACQVVPRLMAADPTFAGLVDCAGQKIEEEMAEMAKRVRQCRVNNAALLPVRLSTTQVLDLVCISAPTLAKRIREGTLPPPIDKARERIFDRDDVLRAIGLLPPAQIAATPPSEEQVATW